MSENNTDALRTWLRVLPIIFILFLAAVFVGFVNVEGLTTQQRLDYGIKALTTTGTIFAGIAVFINAFYAAKRAEAMDKSAMAANESAKAALKNAEAAIQNAKAAQDKQITERFAKAIEQLGSEKIEVRLGAIYTLERIAKDSKDDHWTIMEVLTAFVRENAPRRLEEENTENTQQIPKIRTDIQTALTVIGRRNSENEEEHQELDLNSIDIRGANLYKANLEKANLYQANLEKATLNEANLQQAFLRKAKLQKANLSEANLKEALLSEANLQAAFLWRANLQEVNLGEAKLQGVLFFETNLQGALLFETNFYGANLTGVENLEQKQIDLARGDRTTILPDYLEYPTHWQ
ncbi:pentapeptide repeat-containing protein [Nostoc sp. LEGE 06077]|uniref:pentapeptide repeat-containing protein n=1 Tax=Nostoc sp. LEGE 06077 TaxID=915325 RepID=UPI001882FEED|nr:pentapeptide repeat-containing protein [Nostoc sp. LEGE 06077]MBE9207941.1 pentapeptide repeat-containing protein [Nostoc sp. LEGE 06077]